MKTMWWWWSGVCVGSGVRMVAEKAGPEVLTTWLYVQLLAPVVVILGYLLYRGAVSTLTEARG